MNQRVILVRCLVLPPGRHLRSLWLSGPTIVAVGLVAAIVTAVTLPFGKYCKYTSVCYNNFLFILVRLTIIFVSFRLIGDRYIFMIFTCLMFCAYKYCYLHKYPLKPTSKLPLNRYHPSIWARSLRTLLLRLLIAPVLILCFDRSKMFSRLIASILSLTLKIWPVSDVDFHLILVSSHDLPTKSCDYSTSFDSDLWR